MRKSAKKISAIILIFTMVLSMLLTGCSGKDKETGTKTRENRKKAEEPKELSGRYTVDANTPAWKLDKKENTKLTWYVNAGWWGSEWGTDLVTKKIKEDLNLDVEFIVGDDTKLNTLFSSGKLPDIVTTFDGNSSVAKSANRWALSLNDLADKYDPYFYKVAKKDSLNWYKMEDGKTYGYPGYSNTQQDYDDGYIKAATAFVIRKDIYEALGKPAMGTQKEFINVLAQIKDKYPDLIPFGFNAMNNGTGALGIDFQNFIGVPITNADGTWYDRNTDTDYLSWIKTFNKAYSQGLISDDRFADDGTAFQEKISTGKYATIMLAGTPNNSGPLRTWYSSNRDAQYIAIDGPQSTVGNAPTLAQSGLSGWPINYISKNCSDPVKAIEAFTYLLSDEAGILMTFGIEGKTYKINDAGDYELLPEIKNMQQNDAKNFGKKYNLCGFLLFGQDRYSVKRADREEFIAQMQEWGEGKLKTQFVIENTDPDQGTAEARGLSAITTNWNTALVSLIRSKDETAFDQLVNDYKKFREDNDWESILKIRNDKMEKNREKLGLK